MDQVQSPERMNALVGTAEENATVTKVGNTCGLGTMIQTCVYRPHGCRTRFLLRADMRRDIPDDVKGENLSGNRNIPEGPDTAREHFFHGFTVSTAISHLSANPLLP